LGYGGSRWQQMSATCTLKITSKTIYPWGETGEKRKRFVGTDKGVQEGAKLGMTYRFSLRGLIGKRSVRSGSLPRPKERSAPMNHYDQGTLPTLQQSEEGEGREGWGENDKGE